MYNNVFKTWIHSVSFEKLTCTFLFSCTDCQICLWKGVLNEIQMQAYTGDGDYPYKYEEDIVIITKFTFKN